MAHELAHMWFGDQVTLRQWNDIFINEGYASGPQWGYAERSRSADRATNGSTSTYDRTDGPSRSSGRSP